LYKQQVYFIFSITWRFFAAASIFNEILIGRLFLLSMGGFSVAIQIGILVFTLAEFAKVICIKNCVAVFLAPTQKQESGNQSFTDFHFLA
jgi:hypothetical protein